MKVGLGVIVLDGMPFLPYAIEAAHAVADKIVIVEGAVPAAKRECVDGFASNDGTEVFLAALEQDPDVLVVRAGNQADKTGMWNLYLKHMQDCDYVLNLDSDEIISSQSDLLADLDYMESHPEVDRLDLPVTQFYTDFDHTVHGGIWDHPFRRLWRMQRGCLFQTHRPPYMREREVGVEAPNTRLYHYSWLGVERARKKSEFYQNLRPNHPQYGRHMEWYERVYLRACEDKGFHGILGEFGLHVGEKGPLSVMKPFEGEHPEPIATALLSRKLCIEDL